MAATKFANDIEYFTPQSFVVCPSCKEILGDRFRAINAAIIGKRKKEAVNTQQLNRMMLQANVASPIDDILDVFQIKNECCRAHVISCVDNERA